MSALCSVVTLALLLQCAFFIMSLVNECGFFGLVFSSPSLMH